MLKKSKLTTNQAEWLKENYRSMNNVMLAKKINISKHTIKHVLNFYDLYKSVEPSKYNTPEYVEYIKANIHNTTIKDLAKYMGCSSRTVSTVMERNGIDCIIKEAHKKAKVCDGFFHHDPDLATI